MEQTEFERRRDGLVREIGGSMESVLQNLNALNRSLEGVGAVGREFESVSTLWKEFYHAEPGRRKSQDDTPPGRSTG